MELLLPVPAGVPFVPAFVLGDDPLLEPLPPSAPVDADAAVLDGLSVEPAFSDVEELPRLSLR